MEKLKCILSVCTVASCGVLFAGCDGAADPVVNVLTSDPKGDTAPDDPETGTSSDNGDGDDNNPVEWTLAGDPVIDTLADVPIVWTWEEPLGAAAEIESLHRHVFAYVTNEAGPRDPGEVAREVCDKIRGTIRGWGPYQANQIDVFLGAFGNGTDPDYPDLYPPDYEGWTAIPLELHPDDALDPKYGGFSTDPQDPNFCHYWETPWMNHGIADTKAWMQDFIGEYKRQQASDARLPDPTRFHFDHEVYWYTVCHVDTEVRTFAAMMRDPRWNDPNWPIPGFYRAPGDPSTAQTLAELYAQLCQDWSGNPKNGPFDPTLRWEEGSNQVWYTWYMSLWLQAMEAALDETAYSLIHEAWPNCLVSNYLTSLRLDGVVEDPNDVFTGGRWWNDCTPYLRAWYHPTWTGLGDFQTPVLYPFSSFYLARATDNPSHPLYNYSDDDAHIAVYRRLLEACIDSQGGHHADELMPWISLTGTRPHGTETSKSLCRRTLALLRAIGVGELVVYNNAGGQTESNWNAFADVFDQVWGTGLGAVTLITGANEPPGDALTRVRYSDRYDLTTSAADTGSNYEATVQADFVTDFANTPEHLRVHVEARLGSGGSNATTVLWMWNHAEETWKSVGSSFTLPSSGQRAIEYRDLTVGDLGDYMDDAGRVSVRVKCTSSTAFTSAIDLIQLVGSDDDE